MEISTQKGIQWRKSLLVMNGTAYVPVPKQWMETYGIKKGDSLIVEALPDELRIRPDRRDSL